MDWKLQTDLVRGWEKLAQKDYKRWHDNVAKKVHWDLFKKNGLEHMEKSYEHVTERAVENEEAKVLRDTNVQGDNAIQARRSDIIVTDKKEQKGIIIDIGVWADVRVEEKEREKLEKYQELKRYRNIAKTQNGRSHAWNDGNENNQNMMLNKR